LEVLGASTDNQSILGPALDVATTFNLWEPWLRRMLNDSTAQSPKPFDPEKAKVPSGAAFPSTFNSAGREFPEAYRTDIL
jgi:hypothetical protein